jgi:hypothetical protein
MSEHVVLPNWKKVPKQALTDAIRNTSGIPYPSALTRQDKADLIVMVEAVWETWDEDSRSDFLRRLNVEVSYQRQKSSSE